MSNLVASATGSAAIEYAQHGFHVLPLWWAVDGVCQCHEGAACDYTAKHPMNRHGSRGATTRVPLLREVWRRYPLANVGIRTGVVCDVLDVDSDEANEAFGNLMGTQPNVTFSDVWMQGPMALTARGVHIYYASTGLRNATAVRGIKGIDWRGDGGYVVAPPSVHTTGHVYAWHERCPWDSELWLPHPALMALLAPQPLPASVRVALVRSRRFGRCNPDGIIRKVANTAEGERNKLTYWAARTLEDEYQNGRLNEDELADALDELRTAAIETGLKPRAIDLTIASGRKRGGA